MDEKELRAMLSVQADTKAPVDMLLEDFGVGRDDISAVDLDAWSVTLLDGTVLK